MKSSLKVATLLSYCTLILGNIISLFYTPFMLNTLGREEYGLFSLTNSIIAYIYLIDMGFSNAVIRYNANYIAKNDEIGRQRLNGMFLLLYCFVSLVGIIVGGVLYSKFDVLFNQGLTSIEISKMKAMFIVAMINLGFAFPFNLFSGIVISEERFVYSKLLACIRTILNPLVMVSVLAIGYGAVGMLIGSTIFNLVLGVCNIVYCFKNLKVKFLFNGLDKKIFIELFKFSFFIFLNSIAYQIYWNTDQFVLGIYVGAASIAIYSIGNQFNSYFTSFSNVVTGMFLPKLTKLTTNNQNSDEIMKLLIKVSRIQYFIATLILMGFVLIGKRFIYIWSGDGYEVSYYIAVLVMVPQLVSIIQSLFATLLEAMNKHKVKSIIYLGVAILNLLLTIVLVRPYGIMGCVFSTMIGMLVNALLNNIYYQYALKMNMKYYWMEILRLIPISVIVFLVGIVFLKLINPFTYIGIFIFIILFTFMYFILTWLFSLNKEEKEIISTLVSKLSYKKY